jgi:hypothetical protein
MHAAIDTQCDRDSSKGKEQRVDTQNLNPTTRRSHLAYDQIEQCAYRKQGKAKGRRRSDIWGTL